MSREAMKQALEALENISNWLPTIGQKGLRDYEADAITALREALAQPVQLAHAPTYSELDRIASDLQALCDQQAMRLGALEAQPEQWEPEDTAYRPGGIPQAITQTPQEHSSNEQFTPDWDEKAVMVEEMQRMAKQIAEMKSEQEPILQDIEQYRMQMAGICTAAIGYWKEGDGIHPDYDTLALRDVAKLYAKYDALYKAQPDHIVSLTDKGDTPKIGCVQHDCDECQQLPEQMAQLGWQCFECPACGSEGARAFPKPEEEPVAWLRADGMKAMEADEKESWIASNNPELVAEYTIPLYTSPPQRQPLTDDEIWQMVNDCVIGGDLHADKFARAIEAKLKDKNSVS